MSNNDNFHNQTIKLVQENNINVLPHDDEAEEVLLEVYYLIMLH